MKRPHVFRAAPLALAMAIGCQADAASVQSGDLAVVGYDAQNETFKLLVLNDLLAGTTFHATDKAWNGTGLRTGEGILTISLTNAVNAGTVLTFDSDPMVFANSGDQLLLLADSAAPFNPIFAFNMDQAWETDPGSLNSNNTLLPSTASGDVPNLLTGVDRKYAGFAADPTISRTASEWLDLVQDPSQWTFSTSSAAAYNDVPTAFAITPTATVVPAPTSAAIAFAGLAGLISRRRRSN